MEPFLAQIIMFGGNFAPRDWAFCDGQLLPISQYTALFSLLGTTYGGDGRTTFGLPDLRGRFPMHPGNGPGLTQRILGQKAGAERVNLTVSQIPSHNHGAGNLSGAIQVNEEDGTSNESAGKNFGTFSAGTPFNSDATDNAMAAGSIKITGGDTSNTGGGQAIQIENPFQCVNFIIALQGTFPSRN
jgi:microcystin-dependent protein